jgi:hypothetical protein
MLVGAANVPPMRWSVWDISSQLNHRFLHKFLSRQLGPAMGCLRKAPVQPSIPRIVVHRSVLLVDENRAFGPRFADMAYSEYENLLESWAEQQSTTLEVGYEK